MNFDLRNKSKTYCRNGITKIEFILKSRVEPFYFWLIPYDLYRITYTIQLITWSLILKSYRRLSGIAENFIRCSRNARKCKKSIQNIWTRKGCDNFPKFTKSLSCYGRTFYRWSNQAYAMLPYVIYNIISWPLAIWYGPYDISSIYGPYHISSI